MKKIFFLILIASCTQAENAIQFTVSKKRAQQAHMPLAIVILDKENDELTQIATTIKKDLQFTDQFHASIKKHNAHLPKKELRKKLQKLCADGIPIALCIDSKTDDSIEWRLFDTTQCTEIAHKKQKKQGNVVRGWAHAIADETWKALTGKDGFFSSRLAYCKDSKNDHGNIIRKVYIADFDGSNEELIVDLPTICVAPRWHAQKPHLFYSEYADTNVRLMSISMKKKRKSISSLDGINMLASFSPDGTSTMYCASRGDGSCQLYYLKNGTLKRFTNNSGNNTSPIFLDNDRICFCSDFQTGSPQIYIGNIQTGHLQRITHGGYCTSPNYCPQSNKIAYHKMIQNTMQIFVYDCASKTHTQQTSTQGNKHEVNWSCDGTRLIFAHEVPHKTSRLATLNLATNKTKYLTSAHEQCSYPHQSPCYETFPVVISTI